MYEATGLCFRNHGDVLFLYIVHLSELNDCVGFLNHLDVEKDVCHITAVSLLNVLQPSYII